LHLWWRLWAGQPIFLSFCDWCNKPVSTFRDSLDILLSAWSFAQRFTDGGNVNRQVRLFDEAVRPDLPHQLILHYQAAIAAAEGQQDLKRFWRQGYRLTVAKQELFARIATESTELVEHLCFGGHGVLANYLEIPYEPLRTVLVSPA